MKTASLALWGLPLDAYLPVARTAEDLGFDGVWLGDHLVTPTNPRTPFPYSESSGYTPLTPWPDVWVMLAHMAAGTQSLRLATGVFVLPLRNVFAAAKAVATTQEVSGGRVTLGIGVGWLKDEFEAVGAPWEARGRRTEEMLEIMTRLWAGERVSSGGPFFEFDELIMAPATTRPPIVFGGVSEPALKRAARLGDGWLSPSRWTLEESAATRARIESELAAVGRSSESFEYYVRLNDPSPASVEKAKELGHEHLVVPLPVDSDVHRLVEAVSKIAASIGLS